MWLVNNHQTVAIAHDQIKPGMLIAIDGYDYGIKVDAIERSNRGLRIVSSYSRRLIEPKRNVRMFITDKRGYLVPQQHVLDRFARSTNA